jgi:NADH dehydrogenase [ubiquinone] 1 alpha subcomplex assembly factor 2
VRQIQLRQNAQLADARWNAKPSVLDKPRRGNQELGVGDGEAPGTVGKRGEPGPTRAVGETTVKERSEGEERERENPWKQKDRGVPGQTWQPEAWTPGPVRR